MLTAEWLTTPATKKVIAALEAARPGGSRFVGGCVRNALLGQPTDDIDIATQLPPDAVIAAARAAGLGAVPTGIEHGTITLIADRRPFEVTTLRRDVSTDGRRATVAFTESWDEDAQRRDFRLNALYAEPDGTLHDPTGGGLGDAHAGRIIFIGDAGARIREDYLRILRFFRFSAWYAKGPLDARGLAACAAMKDGLAQLSAERVWKEVKKLLAARDPRAAITAMADMHVLRAALPEAVNRARFEALVGIGQGDALVRLAALLADEDAARALAQRLKLSNEERVRLTAALAPGAPLTSTLGAKDARRMLYLLGPQTFADRVLLAWAEFGADAAWLALLAQSAQYQRPKLPLTGEEIMAAGVPGGPKVGEVMRAVEAWWIEADFSEDRAALAARLEEAVRDQTR